MISAKFEDEIWIYFQTNLRARTRKEYWNVIRSFDKLTGHDPLKLTRKDAMNYYNNLIEKVNSGRLSYNTAVMRLSVMKSVCTFIETYTINHGSGGFWRILLMDKEDGSVGKYDWKIQIKPYTCMA